MAGDGEAAPAAADGDGTTEATADAAGLTAADGDGDGAADGAGEDGAGAAGLAVAGAAGALVGAAGAELQPLNRRTAAIGRIEVHGALQPPRARRHATTVDMRPIVGICQKFAVVAGIPVILPIEPCPQPRPGMR